MNNQSVHGFIIVLVFLFFATAVPFTAGQSAAPPPRPYGLVFLFFATAVPFTAGQSAAPPPRPYGLNSEFNPTVAIFIVSLISAFFFLGFFLIYLRQCGDGRNGGSTIRPTNGAGGRSRRGKRGLDPDVIETFPIVNYSDVKGLKIGKGALECAVCLNEFEDDETLRLLPKCDHVFHPECIDAWLVAHVTCPVCRANLKPESIDVVVTNDVAAAAAREVSDPDDESDERNNEAASEVMISVAPQDPQSEVINLNQTPIQNRPVSLEPTRIDGKFPRSHSTGHSLIQPGENCERFTLRLPDDVRKRIVNGRLNRTTSCLAIPTGEGSVSGGRGEGSSRGRSIRSGRGIDRNLKSDRWIFSMAPPFFTRTSSVKSPKVTDGDGDGSVGGGSTSSSVFPRGLRNSVKSPLPLDCLGAKGEGSTESTDDVSNGRPPV